MRYEPFFHALVQDLDKLVWPLVILVVVVAILYWASQS